MAGPEDTRGRILAAADTLLGSLGFDATTTRDIAERSGVNKALIHYHFGSKDELLTALLDGYYDRLGATLAAALGRGGSPEEQALAVLDAWADFLAHNRTFCSIIQREVAGGRHVEQIVARTLPMFRMGNAWLAQLAPGADGQAEFIQLLTSVYGMVITYFTYGGVLGQLTGTDPFSPAALEARRQHVRRVVTLLFRDAVPAKPQPRGGRPWTGSTPATPRRRRGS